MPNCLLLISLGLKWLTILYDNDNLMNIITKRNKHDHHAENLIFMASSIIMSQPEDGRGGGM